MPQELPGFFYDAEKNRYFPVKGPIPGTTCRSSSTAAHKPNSKPTQSTNSPRTRARSSKLLQARELNGNVLSLSNGKRNFKEEFQKRLISQPMVWRYHMANKTGDTALEQIELNVQTPEGQVRTDFLVTGSGNGSFSLFEVGNLGQHAHDAVKFTPNRVWRNTKENETGSFKAPDNIWRLNKASVLMPSSVSSIKLFGKQPSCVTDDGPLRHILFTSLGSETSGGAVYVFNLDDPLDIGPSFSVVRHRTMHLVASLNCTVWTAEFSTNPSQAVIGTNLGAAMVNMETGTPTWICRSKSDILAQQVIQSGNAVVCGFRNGAILTVDVRERQQGSPSRPGRRHRIPYSSLQRNHQNTNAHWFELKANIWPSHTVSMPSSISCLQSLQLCDQYFLASSMDGTVRLYDHRLMKRGAVQSYEGHVNSHSRIQLGVDQSEKFVMSGGEDCKLRIWSIKSGELLFEDQFSNSIPTAMCWKTRRCTGPKDEVQSQKDFDIGTVDGWEAWVGTQEGLFRMNWP